MKKYLLTICMAMGLFLSFQLNAQTTNTVSGIVTDKDTRQPLIGATVMVADLESPIGAVTDADGKYTIDNVPVGRHTIRCNYIGYSPFEDVNVIVNSVKTTVINIVLVEDVFTTEEVVVNAFREAGEAVNELAVVSARSFSAEETERYAASVNDPGRMALSFPGVQQGRDDSENDIIIRGNSSIGMLWRLEGIDIPNPNHFARPGTSGGGVTVFSAQLLNRSDFYTGAMPAEYGNALSGAFDVNFRTGNLNDYEYRTKIGLLGLDFMAEGPLKKGKSSFLVNYRYSTLGILTKMGVYLVGYKVTNTFQDLSFNLSFQGKSGKDFVTVFGIGGLSEEHYMPYNIEERVDGERRDVEDRVRSGDMGAKGITYTRLIDDASYLKAVVAVMGGWITFVDDTVDTYNNDAKFRYSTDKYNDWRIASAVSYNRKLSERTKFKTGIHVNKIFYDYYKETIKRNSDTDPNIVYGVSLNGKSDTETFQTYAQFSSQLSSKVTLNYGAHVLGFGVNNKWGIDPRVSMLYTPHPRHKISLSYGIHSQNVGLGTFFYEDALGNKPNQNLDLMKAQHFIGGYKVSMNKGFRLGVEAYYQNLWNVPIRPNWDDSYWMLNSQAYFPSFEVVSEGTGENYGLDLSLEKAFSKGMFMLITGSLFESNYVANTGKVYSTNFDTRFSTSTTLGKEVLVRGKNTLQYGGRILFNGGPRYTPFDPVESELQGNWVAVPYSYYTEQVSPYFRIDGRISYRINGKKTASVLSLDIQNVTNRMNSRTVGYNAETNEASYEDYTSGLVPILSYQIDF